MPQKRKADISSSAATQKQRRVSKSVEKTGRKSAILDQDTAAWPEYFESVCDLASIIEL
jgi:hypothetical protein